MILGSGMTMPMKGRATHSWRLRNKVPAVFSSATINGVFRIDSEQLRNQIQQLQAEAEITRSNANNARLRLMRLSEAAENFQRRVGMDVARSRENDARELLMQKKKLLQALEKTRRRLNVLNQLSLKINEAISLKETQLLGSLTIFPDINREDSDQEIRIITPKSCINIDEKNAAKPCDKENITTINDKLLSFKEAAIPSYEDFLEHVDGQLIQTESDICNFLRLSAMNSDNKQRQMNPEMQQLSDILDHLRSTRERIASIMKKKSE